MKEKRNKNDCEIIWFSTADFERMQNSLRYKHESDNFCVWFSTIKTPQNEQGVKTKPARWHCQISTRKLLFLVTRKTGEFFCFFIMVTVFHTVFLQNEFKRLYQKIIPALNECDFCGVTKCMYCKKFDVSCLLCRDARCKHCLAYCNTIRLFLKTPTNRSEITCAIFCTTCTESTG